MHKMGSGGAPGHRATFVSRFVHSYVCAVARVSERVPAQETIIADPISIFLTLAAVVFLALQLEKRVGVFRSLGAALTGILIGMLLSNTGLLPGNSPTYDFLMGTGGQRVQTVQSRHARTSRTSMKRKNSAKKTATAAPVDRSVRST